MIKIYYDFSSDILCIVEGKKIYKFIGDYSTEFVRELALGKYGLETWYKAHNHPSLCYGFKLVGKL